MRFLILLLMLLSIDTLAQQVPAAASTLAYDSMQVPEHNKQKPSLGTAQVPGASEAGFNQMQNLIRAQTGVIQLLSSKIKTLEERVSKLEAGNE
ncbi:hypothetical protein [Oceanicoccus sp. KOV_DT_Chl]|uniref:hypothetical protein n=1 Tax=Oceanicoccus sp. KOV_DT_Chl TaxID=1904639 RepID=UPI0011AECBDC|nr:hypothetical protein [Oceanicoccus sp. KOV_DT_Chl]